MRADWELREQDLKTTVETLVRVYKRCSYIQDKSDILSAIRSISKSIKDVTIDSPDTSVKPPKKEPLKPRSARARVYLLGDGTPIYKKELLEILGISSSTLSLRLRSGKNISEIQEEFSVPRSNTGSTPSKNHEWNRQSYIGIIKERLKK